MRVFKIAFVLLFLSFVSMANIYSQVKFIYSWNDPKISSGELYNQTVTVEGRVASVYNFVRAAFIYFGDPNRDFMAVVYYSNFGDFDYKINDYFSGKVIRITGTLEDSKGQPIIVIKSKSQVEVLEAGGEITPANNTSVETNEIDIL